MSSETATNCDKWVARVHMVQKQRAPEEWEATRQRLEQSRQHEASYRKCKAAKGHAVRSRAMATEGLRQIASSNAEDQQAVQDRWQSAQSASKHRQTNAFSRYSKAPTSTSQRRSCPAWTEEAEDSASQPEVAQALREASSSDDEAMEEAADFMGGGATASSMAALGNEGVLALAAPEPETRGGSFRSAQPTAPARPGAGGVQEILKQLKVEPTDPTECSTKFGLYENYSKEVEEIRTTLLTLHEENLKTIPVAVASDMDTQIRKIDCQEAMGILDDAREWLVYSMMAKAEQNNLKMAVILEGYENKLKFLASNDQAECPICLEAFADSGEHAPETLGCCHKVCKDCWVNWTAMMHNRPFCPLCRHEDFAGAIASRIAGH